MFRCPGRRIQLLSVVVVPMVLVCPRSALAAEQSGVVRSGDTPIAFSTVTLYKAGAHRRAAVALGRAHSDAGGFFTITYTQPSDTDAVLYLVADGLSRNGRSPGPRKSPTRLAAVLGTAPVVGDVVINERSTVATAYAMAQFIDGHSIGGKAPGLQCQQRHQVSSRESGSYSHARPDRRRQAL